MSSGNPKTNRKGPEPSSAATGSEARVTHTCATCGHKWKSVDATIAGYVILAAKMNGQGPYCAVCQHLEMAYRYAEQRDEATTFTDVVTNWLNLRTPPNAEVSEVAVADATKTRGVRPPLSLD